MIPEQLDLIDLCDRYPHRPGWQGTDTSRAAAESIAPTAATYRQRALALIRKAGAVGLTADEVAERMGVSILTIRPRVTELKKLGEIVARFENGARVTRQNASGRQAAVWRAA